MSIDQGDLPQSSSEGTPVKDSPRELLARNVESAKKAVDALVKFAVEHGADKSKFDHLDKVWDSSCYFPIPRDKIPGGARALTVGGEVFVGEEDVGNLAVVLHESIHRVANLNTRGKPHYAEMVAGLYGFVYNRGTRSLEPLESSEIRFIPESDREAYLKEMEKQIKYVASLLSEGLTEWTAQRANGLTTQDGEVISIEPIYPLHRELIESMYELSGLPREEFEALIIETAFSGEILHMMERMGDVMPTYLSLIAPILSDHYKVNTIGDLKKEMGIK